MIPEENRLRIVTPRHYRWIKANGHEPQYTIDEAARALQISVRTVQRLLARGVLGGEHVLRRDGHIRLWKIPESELQRLIDESTNFRDLREAA